MDTGFDGLLRMLVPRAVTLGLELIDVAQSNVTDGIIRDHDLVFAGQTEWDGDVKDVDVLPTATQDMLIGVEFLKRFPVRFNDAATTVEIECVFKASNGD